MMSPVLHCTQNETAYFCFRSSDSDLQCALHPASHVVSNTKYKYTQMREYYRPGDDIECVIMYARKCNNESQLYTACGVDDCGDVHTNQLRPPVIIDCDSPTFATVRLVTYVSFGRHKSSITKDAFEDGLGPLGGRC